MDNFDLTKYLAEGKLHEFTDAISPEEVRDMAQMVADAFTAEDAEGDRFSTYMVYKVGNVDGMSFELDTEATEQTPEDDAKYGTGEGWGGMFRVKPTDNGYEIRNSEKGGLVATMDGSGFTMLDAEQSKAEMGGDTDYMERRKEMSDYMEEGEAPKSNKMKKSELKEMIKAAMLAETSVEETLVDADQDMAEAILNALGGEAAFEAVVRAMSTDDAQTYLGAIIRDHDIEMGPVGDIPGFEGTMDALDSLSIREEEEEDVEDVEIDTEEEVDVDMDMDSEPEGIDVKQDAEAELGGTVGDVQDNLEAALMAARELGDEKLEDQIGNTLTFFTRQHVVKEDNELGLEENAASNLELKNIAKQLYLKFKKMGADVELTRSKGAVVLNKKPADGNMDSKDVFIFVDDDGVVVDLVGDKAIGYEDLIKKDFSQFEFRDGGDGETWNNAKTKKLIIYPGKTTSESLNESVDFPIWNKIK